eukprot:m.147368 g.147368  ORF g.147368 m.147368 type:complete len:621 (-) comp14986_c1_seq2:1465-3327(-)
MSSLIAIKANYQGEDIRRFSIAHDATFADVQKSLLQTFGKLGNISWQDEEGDIITIRTEQDWKEAIKGRPTLLRLTLNGTAEFIQEKETKPEEDQRTQPQSSPTQPQPSPGSNFTLPGFEEYLASMMSSQRFPTDQARQETRPGSTPTPVPNPPIVFGMGASGLSGMDDLTKRISEVAVEAASRVVESLGSSGVIPDMAHRVQSQREQSTEIQRDEEREEATPPTSEAGAQKLTDKDVKVIKELRAQMFDKRKYEKDDIVMDILSQGELRRTRLDGTGSRKVIAQFGTKSTQRTVRGLHFLKKVKPYGRVRSVSNECVTYSLANEKSVEALNDPTVAQDVIYGLQKGMRDISKIPQQTPFLQQKQTMKQSPIVATSVASTVEAFYRSALNAFINARLTNSKVANLFPSMHVQIPMRVLYINGTKGSRAWLNANVQPEDYQYKTLAYAGVLFGPGLFMTPVSSVLEATNAGHRNPEPLLRRWTRGLIARGIREIIFAIGLNQASDFCEERVPSQIENGLLRNSIGSVTAGVIAGYFSHVPHNLSTLKLMEPSKSYLQLFREYTKPNEARLPKSWSPNAKYIGSQFIGLLAPRAVMTRTIQIVGTFTILNGIIFVLRDVSPF